MSGSIVSGRENASDYGSRDEGAIVNESVKKEMEDEEEEGNKNRLNLE